MFTLPHNKAVINSYSTFRQKKEMYTVILKENVCVIPQGFKTNVNPKVLRYRYGSLQNRRRFFQAKASRARSASRVRGTIDMEDINTGIIERCDLYFCPMRLLAAMWHSFFATETCNRKFSPRISGLRQRRRYPSLWALPIIAKLFTLLCLTSTCQQSNCCFNLLIMFFQSAI